MSTQSSCSLSGGIDIHCGPTEFINVPLNNGGTYQLCPITSGAAFLDSLDFKSDNLWRNVGIMGGLYAFLLVATIMAIAWVKHLKR